MLNSNVGPKNSGLPDRIADLWTGPEIPSLDRRMQLVASFAQELREYGLANFLYSDGDVLFAHGHRRKQAATGESTAPGLVYLGRWCAAGKRGFVSRALAVEGVDQTVALIASVPLTDEPWEPLAEGELLAIHEGVVVARQPAETNTDQTGAHS